MLVNDVLQNTCKPALARTSLREVAQEEWVEKSRFANLQEYSKNYKQEAWDSMKVDEVLRDILKEGNQLDLARILAAKHRRVVGASARY